MRGEKPMYLDKVRMYSGEFMKTEYPDEASHFHIAWEIFEGVLQDDAERTLNLKGPIVRSVQRFEEDETVMAPQVIRAFSILFSELGDEIHLADAVRLRSLMMDLLFENRFSSEFSMKVVDFVLKKRND
jgi:hypothetical protein